MTCTLRVLCTLERVIKAGRFIGPSGTTIRRLQKQTSTLIYPRGVRSQNTFAVFYSGIAGLDKVKQAAA